MNKSVVIVGASGHGKVVADIVLKNKDNIVGFLDDNTELTESFAGFPVLGTTDQYQKYSDACFVIAIGNAAVREKLVKKLKNVSWYTAIHVLAFALKDVYLCKSIMRDFGTLWLIKMSA